MPSDLSSALEVCIKQDALYKSTFTFTFTYKMSSRPCSSLPGMVMSTTVCCLRSVSTTFSWNSWTACSANPNNYDRLSRLPLCCSSTIQMCGRVLIFHFTRNVCLVGDMSPKCCTVASSVVGVIGVCNCSQMRTSKCTCLILVWVQVLTLARNAQKEFLIGQSSRSHATYRRPSQDSF